MLLIAQKATMPPYFYQLFSFFKWANVALLATYPILIGLVKNSVVENFQVSFWSNIIYVFAILEYINYYYYQLSHDNANDWQYLIQHKKLRRAPLWVDLKRAR